MLLLAVGVVFGVAAGLRRPRLGTHARPLGFVHLPWLGVGAVLPVTSLALHAPIAPIAFAASLALLVSVAMANRHITGLAVVGLGLGLNLAVVALNQGMPVRPDALVQADVVRRTELPATTLRGPRHLETRSDVLSILGDVLPVPVAREVMSFGDLLVVVGATDALREIARRRSRRWTAADREAFAWRQQVTSTRVDHVWGTAPSEAPVSGSQYSANDDVATPADSPPANVRARVRSPDLVAATHSR